MCLFKRGHHIIGLNFFEFNVTIAYCQLPSALKCTLKDYVDISVILNPLTPRGYPLTSKILIKSGQFRLTSLGVNGLTFSIITLGDY